MDAALQRRAQQGYREQSELRSSLLKPSKGRLKNDSYTDKAGKSQFRTLIEAFGADQVIMPGTPTRKVQESVAATPPARRGTPPARPSLEEQFPPESDLPF